MGVRPLLGLFPIARPGLEGSQSHRALEAGFGSLQAEGCSGHEQPYIKIRANAAWNQSRVSPFGTVRQRTFRRSPNGVPNPSNETSALRLVSDLCHQVALERTELLARAAPA